MIELNCCNILIVSRACKEADPEYGALLKELQSFQASQKSIASNLEKMSTCGQKGETVKSTFASWMGTLMECVHDQLWQKFQWEAFIL